MPTDDDVRYVIARMEGMLQAVLPQHAARLDEHDRAITNMSTIMTQQGKDISAVKAVADTRAVAAAERETARHTVPVGWQVAGVLVAVTAVAVTVVLFAFSR